MNEIFCMKIIFSNLNIDKVSWKLDSKKYYLLTFRIVYDKEKNCDNKTKRVKFPFKKTLLLRILKYFS